MQVAALGLALFCLVHAVQPARVHAQPETEATPHGPRVESVEPAVEPKPGWGDGRIMGGHMFAYPLFVPTSFVVSSFGVRAGVELRKVPRFAGAATSGSATTRFQDLTTAIASEGLDSSIRLARALALLVAVSGKARIGTDTSTLLGTGADFTLGGDLGFAVRLVRTDSFQLTLRALAGYSRGSQAGIGPFYQSVRALADQTVQRALAGNTTMAAERQRFDAALQRAARQLLTTISGYRMSGMLTAARSIGRYVGVQGVAGMTFERSDYSTSEFEAELNVNVRMKGNDKLLQGVLGLAFDVGGAPTRGMPVDFVAEYLLMPMRVKHQAPDLDETESALAHQVALGVYYAGRADMQLGVGFYTLLAQARLLGVDAQPSGRPRDLSGSFSFRYIW